MSYVPPWLCGVFKRRNTENLQLQRIIAKLAEFSFTVKYVPGKNHLIADALSRAPVCEPTQEDLVVGSIVVEINEITPVHNLEYYRSLVDDDYCKMIDVEGRPVKAISKNHPGRKFSGH